MAIMSLILQQVQAIRPMQTDVGMASELVTGGWIDSQILELCPGTNFVISTTFAVLLCVEIRLYIKMFSDFEQSFEKFVDHGTKVAVRGNKSTRPRGVEETK